MRRRLVQQDEKASESDEEAEVLLTEDPAEDAPQGPRNLAREYEDMAIGLKYILNLVDEGIRVTQQNKQQEFYERLRYAMKSLTIILRRMN